MKPAIDNPQRCQRCGHLRSEHGAQYPRPCERHDYTWRCTCRAFVQRMAVVVDAPPPLKFKPQTQCAFCVEPNIPGEPTCGSAMCLSNALSLVASLERGE